MRSSMPPAPPLAVSTRRSTSSTKPRCRRRTGSRCRLQAGFGSCRPALARCGRVSSGRRAPRPCCRRASVATSVRRSFTHETGRDADRGCQIDELPRTGDGRRWPATVSLLARRATSAALRTHGSAPKSSPCAAVWAPARTVQGIARCRPGAGGRRRVRTGSHLRRARAANDMPAWPRLLCRLVTSAYV